MNHRSLRLVCFMVVALGIGCTKESVVEVPAGHRGLVCSNDDGPESCGLWMHDPGKVVIREDEKLRLIACEPFVRTASTAARVRDAVEIVVESDAAYDVACTRYEARHAFSLVDGDVGPNHLFAIYGKMGVDEAVRIAATAYLSHEIAKEPERLSDLVAQIALGSDAETGPLKLKRFIVTSVSIRDADGGLKNVYALAGK